LWWKTFQSLDLGISISDVQKTQFKPEVGFFPSNRESPRQIRFGEMERRGRDDRKRKVDELMEKIVNHLHLKPNQ